MTVCIASSNYFPSRSGIATFTRRLAALLERYGHRAIVLTVGDEIPLEEDDSVEIEDNGVTVVKLEKTFLKHYNQYKKYFKPGGIDAPYWIAMGMAMQEWLLINNPWYQIDIIEASAYGGIGAFLQHPSLPPVLLSGHGAFFQYKLYNNNQPDEQTRIIEILELLAFSNADSIISHSPLSKEDIEKYTTKPVYLAKIPFMQENIETIDFIRNIDNGKKYALVVGSLQKLKGVFILCEALSLLSQTHQDLVIKWAGSDNFNHETGQLMSDELQSRYPVIWNKAIEWEKNPDDSRLSQLYRNASFIIIPTIWESFNVISIEASFHAKPIIITDNTGSSFLFKHGEDAWIIRSGNSKALAKAIKHLHNSPDLCIRMGKAAHEKIVEYLKEDKIVDERINIYEQTILNRKTIPKAINLSFLKKYTTGPRRYYYAARELLKKIAGFSKPPN